MFLYRFFRAIAYPFVKLLWPTKIINKDNINLLTDGGIVVCNHYSTPDTLILVEGLFKKEINFLAKADLFKNKLSAKFLSSVGVIPVKREEPDLSAYRTSINVLNAGKVLLVYPEGTRNKEGTQEMGELKHGVASFALKTDKPILPVLFYRKHKVFKRNYLIVGMPFYLSEHGFTRGDLADATSLIAFKMNELRHQVNKIAENGGKANFENNRC